MGSSEHEVVRREASARRLLNVGVAVAVAGVAVQTIAHLTNDLLLDRRFWSLNADVDGNPFTWASFVAAFSAACGCLALARTTPALRVRFTFLAGVLAFFAVDDLTAIHERLGDAIAAGGLPDIDGIWFPLYVPVFAATFWLLWKLGATVPRAGRFIRLGLGLLGVALLCEVAAAGLLAPFDRTAHAWPYTLEVAVEEGSELAGWILVAAGLAAGLQFLRAARDGRQY